MYIRVFRFTSKLEFRFEAWAAHVDRYDRAKDQNFVTLGDMLENDQFPPKWYDKWYSKSGHFPIEIPIKNENGWYPIVYMGL